LIYGKTENSDACGFRIID